MKEKNMKKLILALTLLLLATNGFAGAEDEGQTHNSDVGNWSNSSTLKFVGYEAPDNGNDRVVVILTDDELFISNSRQTCGNQKRIVISEDQPGYQDMFDLALLAKASGMKIRVWALNTSCPETPYGADAYKVKQIQLWD